MSKPIVAIVTVAYNTNADEKINDDLDLHIKRELEKIGYTWTGQGSGPDIPREIFFKKQFIPESRP